MKGLSDKLQKNLIIYIELFIYTIILVVNVFFAIEIHAKVIEKVAPSAQPAELETATLNSLNESLLIVFEEDRWERKSYVDDRGGTYEDKWAKLENPRSPF